MSSFAITPVTGFPPVSDEGFPRFIQFQENGDDVGSRSVENLNFTGNVTATVSADGATVTVRLGGLTWTELANDYTLALTDANQGLAFTGNSGVQYLTVPANANVAFVPGDAVLVLQDGGASVHIVPVSGVDLIYRSSAFNPNTAGEGAALTLIYRGGDRWVVTGDMESA